MASYTNDKKTIVIELIDTYTRDTLDNYVRATVRETAISNMNKGASAIDVADAVFDCINENFSGDATMAAMCKQICPKSVLMVLRNEIITALK